MSATCADESIAVVLSERIGAQTRVLIFHEHQRQRIDGYGPETPGDAPREPRASSTVAGGAQNGGNSSGTSMIPKGRSS